MSQQLASLPVVSASLKGFCLGGELIQLLGVDQRVAFLAYQGPGRQLSRAAAATADQLRSSERHGKGTISILREIRPTSGSKARWENYRWGRGCLARAQL